MDTSTTVWLRPSGMRTRSPPVMILTMRLRASAFAFASTSSLRRRRRRRRFPSRPSRLDDDGEDPSCVRLNAPCPA